MPSEKKLEKLVVQLIRETTEGRLEWHTRPLPAELTEGTDNIVNRYCEADYKNQRIAVFERRFRSYDAEHDVHFWTSRDCLAFLDHRRSISWETSAIPWTISTLLSAAVESAANVDGILDALLD